MVTRTLGVLAASAALTAAALPTHAVDAPVSVSERLGQIALVDDAVPVGQSPLEPVRSGGAVSLGTGESAVSLDLPVDRRTKVSKVDGRYVVPASDGASLAVAPTDTGAQVLIGIEKAGAPTSYDFDLDVPSGSTAQITPDGAVEITRADGELAAQIAAPWAVDAEGRDVPTRFDLRGGVLTQIVEHRAGNFSYPIVADPKIFSCDLRASICVKFTKKETKAIAKKASGGVQAFAAFLCTKIPHPIIAGVCVGTVVAAGSSLRSLFKSAAKQGKCAELHFLVPTGVLWKWKKEKC